MLYIYIYKGYHLILILFTNDFKDIYLYLFGIFDISFQYIQENKFSRILTLKLRNIYREIVQNC